MPTDDNTPKGPPSRRDAARKAWRFGWIATTLLIAVMIAFAAVARLEIFGAGFHINFALILGVLGTTGLGVGLMALSFYSDRSGADDRVIDMSRDEWSEDNREQ